MRVVIGPKALSMLQKSDIHGSDRLLEDTAFLLLFKSFWFLSRQGPEEKNFKTLKRIRKFEKDGKIVTETTSRVVDVSQEDYRNAQMKEQQQR